MYYIASREQRGSGGMIIWRHIKKLKSFKATDGREYVVAKSKKEIVLGDKLVKTRPARYEANSLWDLMLAEFFE